MRKGLIALCILILKGGIFLRAEGAPALFPIRQDGKLGFINAAGETVIPPQFVRGRFEPGNSFAEGLEPVWVGNKAGFIDGAGKVVIEPQFDLAQSFSEGLAAARSGEPPWKWGYIEKTGRFVIPPQFDDAHMFSEGRALVVRSGQNAYIDRSGKIVVPPQFHPYSPEHSTFSEGAACVETERCWGFIDKEGKVIIEARFTQPSSFHEGLAVADLREKFSIRSGYIDKTGTFVIAPRFSLAWRFSEGLARVQDKATMAFIDRNGAIVFTLPEGRWGGEFSEGLVNVRIGRHGPEEKWGYVDRRGKWSIEPRFQQAEPFYHGLARVVVENKIAYINHEGRYIWGPAAP